MSLKTIKLHLSLLWATKIIIAWFVICETLNATFTPEVDRPYYPISYSDWVNHNCEFVFINLIA